MALIFLFVICVQTIGTLFSESSRSLAQVEDIDIIAGHLPGFLAWTVQLGGGAGTEQPDSLFLRDSAQPQFVPRQEYQPFVRPSITDGVYSPAKNLAGQGYSIASVPAAQVDDK